MIASLILEQIHLLWGKLTCVYTTVITKQFYQSMKSFISSVRSFYLISYCSVNKVIDCSIGTGTIADCINRVIYFSSPFCCSSWIYTEKILPHEASFVSTNVFRWLSQGTSSYFHKQQQKLSFLYTRASFITIHNRISFRFRNLLFSKQNNKKKTFTVSFWQF